MEAKLEIFSRELKETDQEILGSLLFTCSGRYPGSLLPINLDDTAASHNANHQPPTPITELNDVKAFETIFPNTPIAGFYAGGEIGPSAIPSQNLSNADSYVSLLADLTNSERASGKGFGPLSLLNPFDPFHSSVQVFTAAFGIFLRPQGLEREADLMDANSSRELSLYVKERLKF